MESFILEKISSGRNHEKGERCIGLKASGKTAFIEKSTAEEGVFSLSVDDIFFNIYNPHYENL